MLPEKNAPEWLLFGYRSDVWAKWLDMWQQAGSPLTLLLAGTQIIDSLKQSGVIPQNALQNDGDVFQTTSVRLVKIPFVPQQDFDKLLHLADCVYHEEDSGKGRLKGKNKVKVGEIHNEEDAIKEIAKLEKAMQQAARDLQFEEAAVIRDRIRGIKENLLFGVE